MLDLKYVINEIDEVISRLSTRNKDYSYLRDVITLNNQRKELLTQVDKINENKNNVAKQIGQLKREGKSVDHILKELDSDKSAQAEIETKLSEIELKIKSILELVPNIPSNVVPIGPDESYNKVVKVVGKIPTFKFPVLDHTELALKNDILDFERAAKVSGTRFVFDKGLGARLERSLIQFMMDTHSEKHGYTEIIAPYLVNYESMYGTGQFPKFESEAFAIKDWNLYLNPTAEVPTINMYRDEILNFSSLPIKYCAYSTAFRSESGASGKDTKGILRQHQFHKVELIKFSKPEDSYADLESMLSDSESILKLLGLPYRVVMLSTGDMGFGSALTYDIEVWLPGQNTYREIASISNDIDFQARRANIRFKRSKNDKPEYVHTLNGSGLAVGRTMIAIIENYQKADGSIDIPEVLWPYMKVKAIKPIQ